jgi:hypothetical protein
MLDVRMRITRSVRRRRALRRGLVPFGADVRLSDLYPERYPTADGYLRANRSTRLCVFPQAKLVSPRDVLGLYALLAVDGASADNPGLAALREAISPDQVERAEANLGHRAFAPGAGP